MTKFLTVFAAILLQASISLGDVVRMEINPSEVNSEARVYRGKHLAFWNPAVASEDLLLVSIGGTNSLPADFTALDTLAANLGYNVLAVDYDNHVISTTCKSSDDDLCFDHFREEVVLGHGVSSLLEVDSANAIDTRISDTLRHLQKTNPQHWSRFFSNGEVAWNKIVVVGHSQGSGHAAFLAKVRGLHGVLMLAGPQDRFEDESRVVSWIHRAGKTEAHRYYSFLHQRDFFGSEGQVKVAKVFLQNEPAEKHIIVTNDEVQDPHMSVITPQFANVWADLLKIQIQKK